MQPSLSPQAGFPAGAFESDATYLIAGGLGALGLTVAEWMVEHGARHLVLMGRRVASATAEQALGRIRHKSGQVAVATGDVTRMGDVARVLEGIAHSMPRLRGVIHAAGMVDDGIVLRLDRDRLRSVIEPKVTGAWNLHSLTLDVPLDFFVLFSSGASLAGFPGLGSYAAANAFLDALAHHRHMLGLPALSINWAYWIGLGMAGHPRVMQLFGERGIGGITRVQGLGALAFLLGQRRAQVAVIPVDSRQYLQTNRSAGDPALVKSLLRENASLPSYGHPSHAESAPARARILLGEQAQRRRAVESIILEHVANVLGLQPSHVDTHHPLTRLGLDSLMAIELKNRLDADLGVRVPVVKLLEGISLEEIAGHVLDQLEQPERPASLLSVAIRDATDGTEEDETSGIGTIDPERAGNLLAKVGDLSNAAVDTLLGHLMERDGGAHRRAAR